MSGHFQFYWSCVLYTQCVFWSIQFTHDSKYIHECRHAFRGARLFWTVAECLDSTYGPYVVTLHTQRRDKQCWQGVWKSQYANERILIWVCCIFFWYARDLQIPTWTETNTPRILQIHKNTCNQKVTECVEPTGDCIINVFFTVQLWAEWNIEDVIPSSTLNHFVRSTSTGAISPKPNFRVYVQEYIYWRESSISCRGEFRFLRYFTDVWKYTSSRLLHLPRISSSSSWSRTYLSQGFFSYSFLMNFKESLEVFSFGTRREKSTYILDESVID